jgi:diacylglycerol O-acyltransferase / wax synthase
MERMSATDAGFFYAEGGNTPMHVGSVSVFEGPAPSYGDLVRLLLGKLPQVPRYRQRVCTVPLHLGRPLWVDDEHFQILYHVRHTAVPHPGGPEQLRNLAGRVLGQRLDMTKPLWEAWLVEGLEEGRWALISKVHHCMVDGIAGTDLMQLIFDVDPDAEHPNPQPWSPEAEPSTAVMLAAGLEDVLTTPARHLQHLLGESYSAGLQLPRLLLERGAVLTAAAPRLARQVARPVARSLNGPIGPHRRWAWAETSIDEIRQVRRGLGGTVNDVVLTAVTRGFRDLLESRGELTDGLAVRTMVPVSVRRPDERGSLNNQVSAVFVELPVGEPDASARLASVRAQMDEYKQVLGAVPARGIVAMGDFVAPTLLALGTRAAARTRQPFTQAVTTNVPGPRVPLYVLGRRMRSLYAYVPIASGLRVSIGIYSYLGDVTFGINADFDAFPDVDVLSEGIGRGMRELLELADTPRAAQGDASLSRTAPATARPAARGKTASTRRTPTRRASSS